ncbi:MAG: substrate-binding domain-containing protein [Gammaproteobacteria bacterium]
MKNMTSVLTGALIALSGFAAAPVLAQTIALVQYNQQALFFTEMTKGAQEAADSVKAKLVVFDANSDPAAQNNAIETYIQQKVNAIVVEAIDTNGIMAAVKQAAAAGIPVIAVDAILPEGPQLAQVGVDNYKAGELIGKTFLEYVDKSMGGKANVGIVGALNSTIQNIRQKGFEDTIAANKNVKVVGVVDGRNVQENAMSASENLFTANPGMNAVYATGEPALIGAVAAVNAQNMGDKIKVFGWDLTQQSIDGIDKGFVIAVVQQSPYGMGKAAVEAALTVIKGGKVDKVVGVPVTIVTKDNVDKFRSK